MKNALVSPNESVAYVSGWDSTGCLWTQVPDGCRVVDVAAEPFDVAPPLFWVDCGDNVFSEGWYWDKVDKTVKPVPAPAADPPISLTQPQPEATGTIAF